MTSQSNQLDKLNNLDATAVAREVMPESQGIASGSLLARMSSCEAGAATSQSNQLGKLNNLDVTAVAREVMPESQGIASGSLLAECFVAGWRCDYRAINLTS